MALETPILKRDSDGTISASYFWFNVINTAVTGAYVLMSWKAAQQPTLPLEGFAWLTLVVAGIITGNKFANKLLEYKYGGSGTTNLGEETVEGKQPKMSGKKVESID